MKKNPQCFISYCHEDIDRTLVDYLILVIQSVTGGRISFFYDDNLSAGENLHKFMAKTLEVDVALLLLTPSYKRKVDRHEGGAYREFQTIMERYWTLEEKLKKEGRAEGAQGAEHFAVIPVVLSGSIEDSLPKIIDHLLCANLVGLAVSRDDAGQIIIPDFLKQRFSKELSRITDQIVAIYNLRTTAFLDSKKALWDTLFVNRKTTKELLKLLIFTR